MGYTPFPELYTVYRVSFLLCLVINLYSYVGTMVNISVCVWGGGGWPLSAPILLFNAHQIPCTYITVNLQITRTLPVAHVSMKTYS